MNPSPSPAPSLEPYLLPPEPRIVAVALEGLAILASLPVERALAAIRRRRP